MHRENTSQHPRSLSLHLWENKNVRKHNNKPLHTVKPFSMRMVLLYSVHGFAQCVCISFLCVPHSSGVIMGRLSTAASTAVLIKRCFGLYTF